MLVPICYYEEYCRYCRSCNSRKKSNDIVHVYVAVGMMELFGLTYCLIFSR